MGPTLSDILDILTKGGVIALLVVILVTGGQGWWVWGWIYKAKIQEASEWQAIAKAQIENAEVITKQAERALDLAERMQDRRHTHDERAS